MTLAPDESLDLRHRRGRFRNDESALRVDDHQRPVASTRRHA
jgi:hypothetical protein